MSIPLTDALKRLDVSFFNSVVGTALMSLQERFQTMSQVKDRFGVLLEISKVKEMSKEDLLKNIAQKCRRR